MKINVIGAGRLGRSLAHACMTNRVASSLMVCNRTLYSTQQAIKAIGAGHAIETINHAPPADVWFITAPDDAIELIATHLAHSNSIQPGHIIAHCSGVLEAKILEPVRQQGALVASVHPLRAFNSNAIHKHAFQDCTCIMEGDPEALTRLMDLFAQIGARPLAMTELNKAAYHAAATMASNYTVTLANSATELFLNAGLSKQEARRMTLDLMNNSLDNLQNTTHFAEALTGPLVRGDINTINAHLNTIQSPAIHRLYRAAGLATLLLTDKLPNNPLETLLD